MTITLPTDDSNSSTGMVVYEARVGMTSYPPVTQPEDPLAEHECDQVRQAFLFPNGMLAVFCIHGYQMPLYQGPVEDVGARLNEIFAQYKWITQ